MHAHMHTRLASLRKELEKGQGELAQVERQRAYLQDTLLRISGAIQVLEELLADAPPTGHNGTSPGASHPTAAHPGARPV